MGYNSKDLKKAVSEFENLTSFNTRASHRCSSTLRYLKLNDFSISNREEGAKSPLSLVNLIHNSLLKTPEVIIYTDGSTNPKSKSLNSGCSVVITSTRHEILWQGGMTVRTDRNNFLAELAAVACTVKALPSHASMTLRTDSQHRGHIQRSGVGKKKS